MELARHNFLKARYQDFEISIIRAARARLSGMGMCMYVKTAAAFIQSFLHRPANGGPVYFGADSYVVNIVFITHLEVVESEKQMVPTS